MERKCENCIWGNEFQDFACDLGFCSSKDRICEHHQFLEGLGKDIEVISCSLTGASDDLYIVERDQNGKVLRYVWFSNTGDDTYYNFCIGMWDKNASKTGTFKMSIKPEDDEGLYEALSEFYDLSVSKVFDSVDFRANFFSIEKEDEEVTLKFVKGASFLDSKDSVEVYLGDYFTCTEYDSFMNLLQRFMGSFMNENIKTVRKLLELKRGF